MECYAYDDYEIEEESIPSEEGGIDGCTLAKMYAEDMDGRESDFNAAHAYTKNCIYKIKKRILEELYPKAAYLAFQQHCLKQIMWDMHSNRKLYGQGWKDWSVWVGYVSGELKWQKPYTPLFYKGVRKLAQQIRNGKKEVLALYRRLEACDKYGKRHGRYIAHDDIFVKLSPQFNNCGKFLDEVADGSFKASMANGTSYMCSIY